MAQPYECVANADVNGLLPPPMDPVAEPAYGLPPPAPEYYAPGSPPGGAVDPNAIGAHDAAAVGGGGGAAGGADVPFGVVSLGAHNHEPHHDVPRDNAPSMSVAPPPPLSNAWGPPPSAHDNNAAAPHASGNGNGNGVEGAVAPAAGADAGAVAAGVPPFVAASPQAQPDAGLLPGHHPIGGVGVPVNDVAGDAALALALSQEPVGADVKRGHEVSPDGKEKTFKRLGTTRRNPHGEVEPQHFPIFCALMFAACVIMFIYECYKANWSFTAPSQNPLIGPPAQVLVDIGAKDTDKIVHHGEWWRLIVPIFMHGGVIHLLMNMSVLLRLGKDLELDFGGVRVGFIYMASGVFGNVCSALFLPTSAAVGASGALYGLIGALFGEFFQNHDQIISHREKCLTFTSLLLSTLVGLAFGLLPLLDNFQHVGGCLLGLFLGGVLLGKTVVDPKTKRVVVTANRWLQLIFAGVAAALFIAALFGLYLGSDGNSFCGWCHYISCLETPWWTCDPEVQYCGNLLDTTVLPLNCTHAVYTCFTGAQPNNTFVCP